MKLGIHIHTLLTGNNATLVSGRIQHSEKASNFPSWLLSFAFTIFLTHLVIRDFVRKSEDFSFQENIPCACASLDTALCSEIKNSFNFSLFFQHFLFKSTNLVGLERFGTTVRI